MPVHLPHGDRADVWVELEDGGRRDVRQVDHWVPPRTIDGQEVGEATYELPGDLPLGWHTLAASHGGHTVTAPLVVTPARLQLPDTLAGRRAFGLMTQLYSVRSRRSWGVGDLADLGELAGWAAHDLGADFVLVNPLHAAEPVPPMEPSPYLPTTRRFVNPLYIRVEDIPEMGYVSAAERQLLEWHADDAHALNTDDVIDRDAVLAGQVGGPAHRLPPAPRAPARAARSRRSSSARGRVCSTSPPGARWPRSTGCPGVTGPRSCRTPAARPWRRCARTSPSEVRFHQWLQWVVDEQLGAVQDEARHAGMAIGVIHDLAVGVHPEGADAWGLPEALARRVNVGAPPDPFNQMGQDWSQPPWRPDRLAGAGLRAVPRHAPHRPAPCRRHPGRPRHRPVPAVVGARGDDAGRRHLRALRPRGADRHPRAGGPPRGRPRRRARTSAWSSRGCATTCASAGSSARRSCGSRRTSRAGRCRRSPTASCAWPRSPRTTCRRRPATSPASTSTCASELGLLTRRRGAGAAGRRRRAGGRAVDAARARAAAARRHRERRGRGAAPVPHLDPGAADRGVGVRPDRDRRTINQPGTDEEYPNWRLPLAGPDGTPLLLEDLMASRWARRLARTVAQR